MLGTVIAMKDFIEICVLVNVLMQLLAQWSQCVQKMKFIHINLVIVMNLIVTANIVGTLNCLIRTSSQDVSVTVVIVDITVRVSGMSNAMNKNVSQMLITMTVSGGLLTVAMAQSVMVDEVKMAL